MDRFKGGLCAVALAVGLGAGAAVAGEAQDEIFALGALDGVETGQKIVFSHERTGSAVLPPALAPISEGSVEVLLAPSEVSDGRSAIVTMREGAAQRRLNPFPADGGNPLLMVFMETNVRSMAAVTGGSPFYIRNRMREAIRTQDMGAPVEIELGGETVPGVRYSFRPFEGDRNAERMGAFADLEFSFVVSDAAPGGYALLETVAGPGADGAPALHETIRFERLEGEG